MWNKTRICGSQLDQQIFISPGGDGNFCWRPLGDSLSSHRPEIFAKALSGDLMSQNLHRSSHPNYQVPQRFSVAEILAMTTVFAVLFGGLRYFGAPVMLYMFLGTQAVIVCLVQMSFGSVPRGASTAVGCFFLPLWVWLIPVLSGADPAITTEGTVAELPIVLAFGGLLGYCTGTLAAGVFLVMDAFDGTRHRLTRSRPAP
jgi:hypothetical protein